MLSFFKRYWLFSVLAAVAAFLVFFLFQGGKNKEVAPTPLPNLPKIDFPNLGEQAIPERTAVTINAPIPTAESYAYGVTPKASTKEFTTNVAGKLGFTKDPKEASDVKTGLQYIWTEGAKFLFVGITPFDLLYGIDQSLQKPSESGKLPTSSEATILLEKQLTNLGLETGPNPKSTTQKNSDGSLVEIGLTPIVDETIIVALDPTKSPVAAAFDKSGQLFRLSYKIGFTSPKKGIAYPVKNIEEIKNSLVNEGRIVKLGDAEIPTLIPNSINITKIESALVYMSENPDTLYPIFILEGEASTSQGQKPIWIYIPAPKSEYLNTK